MMTEESVFVGLKIVMFSSGFSMIYASEEINIIHHFLDTVVSKNINIIKTTFVFKI